MSRTYQVDYNTANGDYLGTLMVPGENIQELITKLYHSRDELPEGTEWVSIQLQELSGTENAQIIQDEHASAGIAEHCPDLPEGQQTPADEKFE